MKELPRKLVNKILLKEITLHIPYHFILVNNINFIFNYLYLYFYQIT